MMGKNHRFMVVSGAKKKKSLGKIGRRSAEDVVTVQRAASLLASARFHTRAIINYPWADPPAPTKSGGVERRCVA